MPIEPLPHPAPKGSVFSKLFQKDWKKIQHDKIRKKFIIEVLPIFFENPFDASLRNHDVGTAYENCRSIDVTGDIRVLYVLKDSTVFFVRIGTHSHLYG